MLNAENVYLSTLLARQVVDLHEMALRSYQGHLAHAQSAFKQGTAARYDVIRAEAAVAGQEKRLTEAKNQFALAQAALRTALALDDAAAVKMDGQLFEIERRGRSGPGDCRIDEVEPDPEGVELEDRSGAQQRAHGARRLPAADDGDRRKRSW